MDNHRFHVKIAEQDWELEEVCRLNHLTFAEEIPQHGISGTGLLKDRFHEENQYIICLDGNTIAGMLALRDKRPFSLDYKLEDLDSYLPPHSSLCEVRLLAIRPEYRKTKVFYYLFKEIFIQVCKKRYDYVLISGILSQQRLYRGIGFVPFGPLVGGEVKFQPMYSTPDFYFKSRHNSIALYQGNKTVNAMPGPVDIKNIVLEEFRKKPESHRGETFIHRYKEICASLSSAVRAKNVQICTGSGTMANEMMVAHISALSSKGLILSNGEFGDRIIRQARCQRLRFREYKIPFGDAFEITRLKQLLADDEEISWLFVVHCETSSGVLNDLRGIVETCGEKNVLVFADCVSTFGIIPLDLRGVYMASASSGKAIGSFSGLALVFYNTLIEVPEGTVPVYLDIWHYIRKNGIPFTINSNAVYALGTAVDISDIRGKYEVASTRTAWLKERLRDSELNLDLLESESLHPAIITFKLPDAIRSSDFGASLEKQNVFVNYNSDYLRSLNAVQICLFSDCTPEEAEYVFHTIKECMVHNYTLLKPGEPAPLTRGLEQQ